MSAHLESFKNFLKTREKASQSYVSSNGAPPSEFAPQNGYWEMIHRHADFLKTDKEK